MKAERPTKPTVLVSRCLLGEPVRYDGGHKAHARVLLLRHLGWIAHQPCPEVEAGLPVPRTPINLVEVDGNVQVIESATGRGVTGLIDDVIETHVNRLRDDVPDGCIFKSRSPSCGLGSAPVLHQTETGIMSDGRFSGALSKQFQHCLCVDEVFLEKNTHWAFFLSAVFIHRMSRCSLSIQSAWSIEPPSTALQAFIEDVVGERVSPRVLESTIDALPTELVSEVQEFATSILERHPTIGS